MHTYIHVNMHTNIYTFIHTYVHAWNKNYVPVISFKISSISSSALTHT